jgi:hypothetical protein
VIHMIEFRKGLLATSLLAASYGASGATIDFTAGGFGGATSVGSDPVTTILASPTPITNGQRQDGNTCPTGLDCSFDGIGIRDDELGGNESVTFSWDAPVALTGIHFLDLFRASDNDPAPETAQFVLTYADTNEADRTFTHSAVEVFGNRNSGYSFFQFTVPQVISSLLFSVVDSGNDNVGIGDYAIAGLEFTRATTPNNPVPVPAAAWFMMSALAGYGALGRRRKKSVA